MTYDMESACCSADRLTLISLKEPQNTRGGEAEFLAYQIAGQQFARYMLLPVSVRALPP